MDTGRSSYTDYLQHAALDRDRDRQTTSELHEGRTRARVRAFVWEKETSLSFFPLNVSSGIANRIAGLRSLQRNHVFPVTVAAAVHRQSNHCLGNLIVELRASWGGSVTESKRPRQPLFCTSTCAHRARIHTAREKGQEGEKERDNLSSRRAPLATRVRVVGQFTKREISQDICSLHQQCAL